jgi:hypothetical protein
VDPTPDLSEVEGLEIGGGFFADISTSIPGIDEAMSFAEVMKQVGAARGEPIQERQHVGRAQSLGLPHQWEVRLGKWRLGARTGQGGKAGSCPDAVRTDGKYGRRLTLALPLPQVQSMDYSCIVFDTAPTGHTLRLLQVGPGRGRFQEGPPLNPSRNARHCCRAGVAAARRGPHPTPDLPPSPQFPTTLEKGLSKLISLKDSFGGVVSQVSRMVGAGGPGGEDVVDQLLGKVDQLKVRGKGEGAERASVGRREREGRDAGLGVGSWG